MDILNQFPELSAEWLMRGDGPMVRDEPAAPAPAAAYPGIPYAVAVDASGEELISVWGIKAQGGYMLARAQGQEASVPLDTISVPGYKGRTVRAFEVAGDSMQPIINQGDLVIATITERLDLIQPKHVYVVITDELVTVKRLRGPVKKNEPLELLSDNRYYDPFVLPQKDVREIWHVQALLTRSIPANRDEAYDRMLVLMEMLAQDSQQLRNLLLDVAARYDVKLMGENE
ncbi:helix-turn-helix transcriptional regulator [Hymenobacter sp. APR13]|uniref:S24 family peptidase n=1 Tax=Hymenobacter sp. APR13 TaxID=1356852 RepID=UPI0018CD7241|nr:S24 family peptidase [Hymenobacter sp. APR13]